MKRITLFLLTLALALAAPVGQMAQASLLTVQETKATGSDAGAGDNVGFAVAIGGDTLVVGAPYGATNRNITTIPLTVTGIAANNKLYDGSTTATLNTASAALVGVIS